MKLAKNTPRGYTVAMKAKAKKRTLRRLSIIEGQLRGVRKMAEEERYCVDIITQVSAIKEALSGIEDLILENHLSTHVVDQMKRGQEAKAIAEILKIYKLAQRKK